jgi:hypothetical protein
METSVGRTTKLRQLSYLSIIPRIPRKALYTITQLKKEYPSQTEPLCEELLGTGFPLLPSHGNFYQASSLMDIEG